MSENCLHGGEVVERIFEYDHVEALALKVQLIGVGDLKPKSGVSVLLASALDARRRLVVARQGGEASESPPTGSSLLPRIHSRATSLSIRYGGDTSS